MQSKPAKKIASSEEKRSSRSDPERFVGAETQIKSRTRQIAAAAAGFHTHGISVIREPLAFLFRLKTQQISSGLNHHIGPNLFLLRACFG